MSATACLPAVTVTDDDSGSVTVAGRAAAVNTVLLGLAYTPTTEYEGSDTLNVTVTSKDGSSTSATPGTASTAITVNSVSESQHRECADGADAERKRRQRRDFRRECWTGGGRQRDTVSAVLAVTHGTLHVGTTGVTVTHNGTGSVTVEGSAAAVNTALSGLTPTTEYEGSDTLNVTVTSQGRQQYLCNPRHGLDGDHREPGC